METTTKNIIIAAGTLAVLVSAAFHYRGLFWAKTDLATAAASESRPPISASGAVSSDAALELSDSQLAAIKIGPVGRYPFPVEKEAVGSIDFDEDFSVQVFTPYQGKIILALAQLGDEVKKGQPLYTIDSPNLVQAESTLIGAAATLDLTNKELERAMNLYSTTKGVAQRELEQATSDQQTAEGALKAARDAVRVFGKSEEEIDRVVKARKIDPVLVVPAPLDGRITARNAQPGLLVQPGNAPAPYSVSDISTRWMLASVTETDIPLIQVGQPVEVSVMAYPGRTFSGNIVTIGATVDPVVHRVSTRSSILDPRHELLPGMVATFKIMVQKPEQATAVPVNGVVREGDGTMVAWVAADRHHFSQRTIDVGQQRDGWRQILAGIKPEELVVTDGAVFLDNMLTAPPTD